MYNIVVLYKIYFSELKFPILISSTIWENFLIRIRLFSQAAKKVVKGNHTVRKEK
jgi:hypothetical protein